MCKTISNTTPAKGGGYHLNLTCEKTGKPLIEMTEFGSFCEDLCDYNHEKNLHEKAMNLFDESEKMELSGDLPGAIQNLMNGLFDMVKEERK